MGKAFGHRNNNDHNDLFQTHYGLTYQLLQREKFKGMIHEPFCGFGAINTVLKRCGLDYTCTDKYYEPVISPFMFAEYEQLDFLKDNRIHDNIISNPPYGKITDDLIIHAKKHTKRKIALLLRTNYLSGTGRLNKGVFDNLEKVYIFSRMPELSPFTKKKDSDGSTVKILNPIRSDGKYKTGMIVYAWMIWNMKKRSKNPTIKWIDNQEYVLKKEDYAQVRKDK